MDWGAVAAAAITAVLGFLGTYMSNRKQTTLIAYRLEQLELKVKLHNNLVERMYKAEGQITELQHDVADMKGKIA
jgi:type VI protein secretion system component VasK